MARNATMVRAVFREKDRLDDAGQWDKVAFDRAYRSLQEADASGDDFAALFASAPDAWLPPEERFDAARQSASA